MSGTLADPVPAVRPWGLARAAARAGVAAMALLLVGGGVPATAQTTHLAPAQAVRRADQPARLGAVGSVVVARVAVRTAGVWGGPIPAGLSPRALVWHITLTGSFRLSPCPGGVMGAGSLPVLCILPNCPALPRWPGPRSICFGIWHRIATVSISDATGSWLGVRYGPAVPFGDWSPAPKLVTYPRSGETLTLVVGQFLLLGPALVLPGGRLSGYRPALPEVIAPVAPRVAADTTAFVAERVGSTVILATWHPVCPVGQPCPDYVIAVVLRIRVREPDALPGSA